MAREKSDRDPVTHEDLITLLRAHRLTNNNASQNRLECKFRTAIKEARGMGVLALDILTDLKNLVDPETGESVCPASLNSHLSNTIAHLAAVDAKECRRSIHRPVEARA
jgi:hypothetical protein